MRTRQGLSFYPSPWTNVTQVWALAISTDEKTIVSGAADSVATFWEDCTAQQEEESEKKRIETVQK
jgi:U3 small nucleolar RNA-associated protein 13